MKQYKVWDCKIVIAGDSDTPPGFDSPPRMAAENAIEKAGFEVLANFSGWGGKLTKIEKEIIKRFEDMDHVLMEQIKTTEENLQECIQALIEWAGDGVFDNYAQHIRIIELIEKATGQEWSRE